MLCLLVAPETLQEDQNERLLSDRSLNIHLGSTPVNKMEEKILLSGLCVPEASLGLYSYGELSGYREAKVPCGQHP